VPTPSIGRCWVLQLQAGQRITQKVHRDIDGHVAAHPQRNQESGGFFAISRSNVDQRQALRKLGANVIDMAREDRRFGARRVVLGQAGDRGEET
jgi:hypothetical protein